MRTIRKNVAPDWAEIRAAFEFCQELNEIEREKYLEELGSQNPDLLSEVQSLLTSLHEEKSRFEQPFIPIPLTVTGGAPLSDPLERFKPFWLGNYLALRRLGRGGMAEVILAKNSGPGGFERLVALKRPLAGEIHSDLPKKLFEYEAQMAAVLTHPNLVHIYDFFEIDGQYLLSMEYVEGKDLARIFRRQYQSHTPFPLPCVLFIVMEVCKALEYAHSRTDAITGKPLQLVHRDISPNNIMVSYEGDVKLVDFGIARINHREHLTQTGQVRGTVPYMAPEVASGGKADGRSDLFSLCVLLYESVANEPLFDSENLFGIISLIRDCELPQQKIERLKVSDELKRVLRKGLAKEPFRRYATAGQLEKDLRTCTEAQDTLDPKTRLREHLASLFRPEINHERLELKRALDEAQTLPEPANVRSIPNAIVPPPEPIPAVIQLPPLPEPEPVEVDVPAANSSTPSSLGFGHRVWRFLLIFCFLASVAVSFTLTHSPSLMDAWVESVRAFLQAPQGKNTHR